MKHIKERSERLATPFGFSSIPVQVGKLLDNRGHGDSVWPFEQALIHYAALKFKINGVAPIAASVVPHIVLGEERLRIQNTQGIIEPVPIGNSQQLFSVASAMYFYNVSVLRETRWL